MSFLSKLANKALAVVSKPIVEKTVEKAQAKGFETKPVSQIMAEIHSSAPVQKFASESGKILTTAAIAGAAFGAAAALPALAGGGGGAAAGAGVSGTKLVSAGGALASAGKALSDAPNPVEFEKPKITDLTSQVKMPDASSIAKPLVSTSVPSTSNDVSLFGGIIKSVGNQIVSTVKTEAKKAGTNLVKSTLTSLTKSGQKPGALGAATNTQSTDKAGALQYAEDTPDLGTIITGALKNALPKPKVEVSVPWYVYVIGGVIVLMALTGGSISKMFR